MRYRKVKWSKDWICDNLSLCKGCCVNPSMTQEFYHKLIICLKNLQILLSVDSPDSPLSDEVWLLAQIWDMTKWQSKRFRHPLFSHNSSTVVFLSVFAWVVLGLVLRQEYKLKPSIAMPSCSSLTLSHPSGIKRGLIWDQNLIDRMSNKRDIAQDRWYGYSPLVHTIDNSSWSLQFRAQRNIRLNSLA